MKLILDSQQISVEKKLNELALNLEQQTSSGFFAKIISPKNQLKSFYIYGDVGRGKSMLMKKFFNSLQKTPKIYFHFNAFMRLIHQALHDIRKEEKKYKDELIEAVKRVVKENSVLCFDEFQVTDIADAMLLGRIFSYLFSQGVIVVFTSNSKPQDLYKNGLQRELFLEFVDKILLKNCEVLYLNSPTDYRSLYRKNLSKRYFISNQKNREEIKQIIKNLTDGKKQESTKLQVWGREIKIKKTFSIINRIALESSNPVILKPTNPVILEPSNPVTIEPSNPVILEPKARGSHESSSKTKLTRSSASFHSSKDDAFKIAILNFDEICRVDFAASDYQAICKNFDLIFLLKVPKLTSQDVNEARRFVLFIDEVYENKVALIVLAKTKSEKIYESGVGSEAFFRTVSRLNEIKSDQYWQSSKANLK